jgi:hypothetical protein
MLHKLIVLSSSSRFDFSNSNYNYDNTNTNVSSRVCLISNIDHAHMAKNQENKKSVGNQQMKTIL